MAQGNAGGGFGNRTDSGIGLPLSGPQGLIGPNPAGNAFNGVGLGAPRIDSGIPSPLIGANPVNNQFAGLGQGQSNFGMDLRSLLQNFFNQPQGQAQGRVRPRGRKRRTRQGHAF